ncbi:MAG TPA: hypothetical protein VK752_15595 [Bryobacteraceae bacterium]|jgi:hypothetical protein|nr:hypothetical protein [Bryobacteraceae bacterium]
MTEGDPGLQLKWHRKGLSFSPRVFRTLWRFQTRLYNIVRTVYLALIPVLSAQPRPPIVRDTGRIDIESTLRADPPTSGLDRKFNVLIPRESSTRNGPTFFSRILLDNINHAYFGYELFIEQQQPGAYWATFGKLGVSPLDLAGKGNLKFSLNQDGSTNLDWTLLPLPEIPKPRLIHDGDPLAIELFVDASTGSKLIDDIHIIPPLRINSFLPVPMASSRAPVSAPPVPTVSGPARDFAASDADLQILIPRGVTLNGVRQGSIALRNVHGTLIWLYLPEHGRYVLSLTPRPGLDFKKAGEVRGGLISFNFDGDSILLECSNLIAAGDAPYNLWVLHDDQWEPIAEAQKIRPGLGTVSAAELAALKPK